MFNSQCCRQDRSGASLFRNLLQFASANAVRGASHLPALASLTLLKRLRSEKEANAESYRDECDGLVIFPEWRAYDVPDRPSHQQSHSDGCREDNANNQVKG